MVVVTMARRESSSDSESGSESDINSGDVFTALFLLLPVLVVVLRPALWL